MRRAIQPGSPHILDLPGIFSSVMNRKTVSISDNLHFNFTSSGVSISSRYHDVRYGLSEKEMRDGYRAARDFMRGKDVRINADAWIVTLLNLPDPASMKIVFDGQGMHELTISKKDFIQKFNVLKRKYKARTAQHGQLRMLASSS